MPDQHTNFGYSTVAAAPLPASSGVTLSVQPGDGDMFPATGPFNVTVWPAGATPLASTAEIARVTAVSGDVFTLTRNSETGGIARSILVGDQIGLMATAKLFTDIEQIQPTYYKDEPMVIANGDLFNVVVPVILDSDEYGDISSSDYEPEANYTFVPGSTTLMDTDPLILDSGILGDLGGNPATLLWLDSARCPQVVSTLLIIGV